MKWLASLILAVSLFACNKGVEEFPETPVPPPTGTTIAEILNGPEYTLAKAALTKAGLIGLFSQASKKYTVFLPKNAAFAASGFSQEQIDGMTPAQLGGLFQYHMIPQLQPADSFPTAFANKQIPSFLNPAPDVSPFVRLGLYLAKVGSGLFVNNVPVVGTTQAVNGIIYNPAVLVSPPSELIYQRIATDTALSFLRAAIIRADSGAEEKSRLTYLLGEPSIAVGVNVTLFAPTNSAFRSGLYAMVFPIVWGQVYGKAYAEAKAAGATDEMAAATAKMAADANAPAAATQKTSTPDFFKDETLFPYLSAKAIKGIVVYHLLFDIRAFSVNIPATPTTVPTFLNSAIPDHPGVTINSIWGAQGVTGIKVKGMVNQTAANVLINPKPKGTSDQNFVNGVVHYIDQLLFPM